jgi:hypothetical protein
MSSLLKPKQPLTPEEMSALATQVWRARINLQRHKDRIEPIEEAVRQLERALLDAMIEAKLESVASKHATVSIKRTTFAELYDDRKFFEHVRKTNDFDLVRKQPVISACRARWDDSVEVPGVRPGTRVDLSVTTRSK